MCCINKRIVLPIVYATTELEVLSDKEATAAFQHPEGSDVYATMAANFREFLYKEVPGGFVDELAKLMTTAWDDQRRSQTETEMFGDD